MPNKCTQSNGDKRKDGNSQEKLSKRLEQVLWTTKSIAILRVGNGREIDGYGVQH